MLINRKYILTMLTGAIATTIIVVSCSKDLDKKDPNGEDAGTYFNTSAQILNATNAIYSTFHSVPLVAREWFFVHDLRSDEVSAGGGQLEVPRAQMLSGNTDPSNSVMNSVWNGLYTMIHRANTVIGNAPNATDNAALTARNVGEAKFLRAWAYNELVTMWGPVPLYKAVVKTQEDFQPRAKNPTCTH
jgi:hypothetical protein